MILNRAKDAVPRRHTAKDLSKAAARTRSVLRVFLRSAKGAVPRRHKAKELSRAAARTRPVLRVFLRSAVASLLVAVTLSLSAAAGAAPTDDYITDVVRQKLAADQVVKGGAIEVTVKDGVVTLSGKVAEAKQKSRAERLAHGIKGVKSVVNEVKVEHP